MPRKKIQENRQRLTNKTERNPKDDIARHSPGMALKALQRVRHQDQRNLHNHSEKGDSCTSRTNESAICKIRGSQRVAGKGEF